mmetsp:Transcript_80373/g.120798  ORF Transcript_80373/g.120798 Transcript_80373/m.120798 type:complete len:204 (-) Transcript_80373:583-1194(-)
MGSRLKNYVRTCFLLGICFLRFPLYLTSTLDVLPLHELPPPVVFSAVKQVMAEDAERHQGILHFQVRTKMSSNPKSDIFPKSPRHYGQYVPHAFVSVAELEGGYSKRQSLHHRPRPLHHLRNLLYRSWHGKQISRTIRDITDTFQLRGLVLHRCHDLIPKATIHAVQVVPIVPLHVKKQYRTTNLVGVGKHYAANEIELPYIV